MLIFILGNFVSHEESPCYSWPRRVRFEGQDAGDGRLALVNGHKNTVTIWV